MRLAPQLGRSELGMTKKRRKRHEFFKTEAELCAAFIKWAEPKGWIAYPETCEWDILLVSQHDGTQCGIQAKLRPSLHLFDQALPDRATGWSRGESVGPHYRGILVPHLDRAVAKLCRATGLVYFSVFTGIPYDPVCFHGHSPELDWGHDIHPLPEYVPDVAAGAKSPIRLTPWKIKALEICAVLELKGSITSKQIGQLGISSTRWTNPAMGWLERHPDGKRGVYVAGKNLRFTAQHPTVYQQVLVNVRKRLEMLDSSNLKGLLS